MPLKEPFPPDGAFHRARSLLVGTKSKHSFFFKFGKPTTPMNTYEHLLVRVRLMLCAMYITGTML